MPNSITPEKFIVRDPKYKQSRKYGAFMAETAAALDEIGFDEIANNTEFNFVAVLAGLLTQRAEFIAQHCPPNETAWRQLQRDYGPIMDADFGSLRRASGPPRVTFADKHIKIRNYSGILEKLYPERYSQNGTRFKLLKFTYPVPGTNRTITLMQIGNFREVMPGLLIPQEWKKLGCTTDNPIVFRHPQTMLKGELHDDFIRCVRPLFANAMDETKPLDVREDATITLYWLMSQGTPILRGGSAVSRLMLEYCAEKVGFEVPYTKPGIDLWAEAAATDLVTFKQRFKNDVYFDRTVTRDDVKGWQEDRLREQAAEEAAPATAQELEEPALSDKKTRLNPRERAEARRRQTKKGKRNR